MCLAAGERRSGRGPPEATSRSSADSGLTAAVSAKRAIADGGPLLYGPIQAKVHEPMGSADEDPGGQPDGLAETRMIGSTPPGRKGARAPRLSEASTVATLDQTSPASSYPPTIQKKPLSRKQKGHERRKEKRREKDKEQARAKEQGPCVFTIHEVDSDEWHSVCSDEVGFEDALSLHAGNSGDDLSEQGEETVAGRNDNLAEAFLLTKGTKAQKRNMAQTQRFRQSKEMPAVEQVGLESGDLRIICTQNELHYLGTEEHPPIVEAAREGDMKRIKGILGEDMGTVNDRRMRKEISERNGYDKEWTWWDDTPLIAAARSGHAAAVKLLLESKADPMLEACPLDDVNVNAAAAVKMSLAVCKGTFMGMMKVRQRGENVPKEEARRWKDFNSRLEDILDMLEESGGPEAARPLGNAVGQWFHGDEEVESHLALCRNFLQ